MKNLSTGTGLALLAGAIFAFPFVNRISTIDQAAHAAPPDNGAKAIVCAAAAQAAPTIVWYSVVNNAYEYSSLWRGWSDGRVEVRRVRLNYGVDAGWCSPSTGYPCQSPWYVISDSNQGYNAAADINFDSKVDGDDLGQVLAAWGPAPRNDIPPSDCPLNLVNP